MSSQYPGDPYPSYQEFPQQESAYQQPSYQPPPYQQPWAGGYIIQPILVQRPTNGKAITSMVLGICLALTVCSFFTFFPLAALLGLGTGIPAVILGHMALKEINASSGMQGGKEMAIAGFVLGYVSIAAGLAIFAFSILLFSVFFPGSVFYP
ncbi:MAG TPA: DUF4190 domain-containing protein [Ktedonobacterales bacterium]|jgi:hypothetical protein